MSTENKFELKQNKNRYLTKLYLNGQELDRFNGAYLIPPRLWPTIQIAELPSDTHFGVPTSKETNPDDWQIDFTIEKKDNATVELGFCDWVPQFNRYLYGPNPPLIDIILKKEILSEMAVDKQEVFGLTAEWGEYCDGSCEYILTYLVKVKANTFREAVDAANRFRVKLESLRMKVRAVISSAITEVVAKTTA